MLADTSAGLSLIDRIYEAAFVPEMWPVVLAETAVLASAASGELQILAEGQPPLWQATDITREMLDRFIRGGQWRDCERPLQFLRAGYPGFLCDADVLTPEQMERDPVGRLFADVGLGWQAATVIPLPTGEVVGLTFERRLETGRPAVQDIAALDQLRPHLARAGLMAARLGLQQARATATALQMMGLPAAVLSRTGRVRATNDLLDDMTSTFVATAFGGVSIADAAVDPLFQQAIEAAGSDIEPPVRSIPVKAKGNGAPLVVHVLPLRRNAYDIFSGAEILVAATTVSASNLVPSPSILTGLFDLAPSEARLAVALTQGNSLKAFAAEAGITFGTARKYLDRIYLKTGTHSQSQLVALLKGAQPLGGPA